MVRKIQRRGGKGPGWGARAQGRTSALPAAVPRAALVGGAPGFGLGFSSIERCLSSSSLPAKRKSSVSIRLCQGARLGQGPAACRQHLADIWQGTRWGLSSSTSAWEPHEHGGRGDVGHVLMLLPTCEWPQTPPVTQFLPQALVALPTRGKTCSELKRPWWKGSVRGEAAVSLAALWDLLV